MEDLLERHNRKLQAAIEQVRFAERVRDSVGRRVEREKRGYSEYRDMVVVVAYYRQRVRQRMQKCRNACNVANQDVEVALAH